MLISFHSGEIAWRRMNRFKTKGRDQARFYSKELERQPWPYENGVNATMNFVVVYRVGIPSVRTVTLFLSGCTDWGSTLEQILWFVSQWYLFKLSCLLEATWGITQRWWQLSCIKSLGFLSVVWCIWASHSGTPGPWQLILRLDQGKVGKRLREAGPQVLVKLIEHATLRLEEHLIMKWVLMSVLETWDFGGNMLQVRSSTSPTWINIHTHL